MKFEILKEAEKAVFIRVPEEDKELWIPKYFIKKDGNLSEEAELIVNYFLTILQKKRRERGYINKNCFICD